MHVLVCLLNLVFYAMIALFVLWVVGLVLGMFIPGINIWPTNPPAGPNRVLSLLYLFIGLILLINFLLCAFGGGGTILPPLWTGGYMH